MVTFICTRLHIYFLGFPSIVGFCIKKNVLARAFVKPDIYDGLMQLNWNIFCMSSVSFVYCSIK